jgi:ETC complex I subunit conserved region
MAVVKQAQRIIDKVISSQHMNRLKLPESHPLYSVNTEIPGIFNEVESLDNANLSQLKTGIAQHYRVNNPYKYTEVDEYGRPTYKPSPWGCYKGAEVGGNKSWEQGSLYNSFYGTVSCRTDDFKKPTARIYYVQNTHMQRVCSSRRGTGTGGPIQILFEEDGGFKNPLDGFNRSSLPPQWVLKGFKTVAHAVSLCQNMGYAYEVEVPRLRYVVKKSYSDNFKYRLPKTKDY